MVTAYADHPLSSLPSAHLPLFNTPLGSIFLHSNQSDTNAQTIRRLSNLDCIRAFAAFPGCLDFIRSLKSSRLSLVSTFKKHLTNFLPLTVESTLDSLLFEVSPESTVDGAVVIGLLPTSYITRIEPNPTGGCARNELSNQSRFGLCDYFQSAGFRTFS